MSGQARFCGVLAAIALGLCACVTATPYQPLAPGRAALGGYSDRELGADRFSVSFRGNSRTPRETVETYLLYRAAELAIARGGDWFEMVDRQTTRDRDTVAFPRPFPLRPGYGFGDWRPGWRYYGPDRRWRSWDPYDRDPFWDDEVDVQTIERFEVSAEIALHRGPMPSDNPRAIDARAVIARLGPQIVRPAPDRR